MSEVRVLVVDDQEPFRRAMAAVVEATDGLRRRRRRPTTGEESLDAAAELRPDLVLMDVNLPGIDGIEATRRLTADPDGPVVVLLSTYDEDQVDARRLRRGGATSPKAAFGPDRLSAAWRRPAERPTRAESSSVSATPGS